MPTCKSTALTLARLSFRVPAARLTQFAAFYEQQFAPLLKRHGLSEAAEGDRASMAGGFTRLFEMEWLAELAVARAALHQDSAWKEALQQAGQGFGSTAPDGKLAWALDPYRTPAGPGHTAVVGPGLRHGLWQSFGVEDGLVVHGITAIHQDRQGDLWVASNGEGVCRYDGAWATTFTMADGLVDDRVWAVAADGQGRLWCGTRGGVGCFDGEEWVAYTEADGLADNVVHCLLEDGRGKLWCGTEKGLNCFDGVQWVTYTKVDGLAHDAVLALAADGQGRLWCGTRGGLNCFDGVQWVTYTKVDGLVHDAVLALAEDGQGRLWCGTRGGLSCFENRTWSTYTSAQGFALGHVNSIAEDQEGNLWFGSYRDGVCRYDGSRFTHFTVNDGLANNLVAALWVDQEGDLWVGTWTGVSRYCQAQFLTLTTRDGLASDGVSSIGEGRQGGIWFGTEFGHANRYDGKHLTTLELPSTAGSVWAIREDRAGRMWFGTVYGLFCYDGRQFTHCLAGLGTGQGCAAILEDRAGHLWTGTGMRWDAAGTGLRRYDGQEWTSFTPADGLASDLACALAEDQQGRLWVGGEGGRVSVYDGQRFTCLEGLPSHNVTAIADNRRGGLWLALIWGGVWRWDGQAFAPLAVEGREIYPLANSLVVDREGRLWVGVYGGGVYLYDGQVLQRLARRDGLVHDGVQALLQDRRGDIWIATEGGVTRYRPRNSLPGVRVTDAIVDRRYGPVAALEVSGSQKLVAFEFQGRSWTTRPDSMAYVYRLEGFCDTWRTTYGRQVEYHDLPLGEYTFQVRAVDRDLNYSEPATVHLRIVPDLRFQALTQALSRPGEEFVGSSPALRRVQEQLEQVARTDLTMLIQGETGTGKGLAARLVHRLSSRARGPFIQVNCGALPEGLVESELFGHERGAFTGAVARQLGKIELAEGGTLFLDEVGDLPPAAQAKLLQVLEERTFARVGGKGILRAQVRVVAATNRDLRRMIAAGSFREDLYFRLQGFEVALPPLRQRLEDIPELALFFAGQMANHLDKKIEGFGPGAMDLLHHYAWPGNVRELEHVVQRAVVVCAGEVIGAEDLFFGEVPTGAATEELVTLEEHERRYLRAVLEKTGWAIRGPKGAAAILGLNESTLRFRMKRLGIVRPDA